MNNAYYIKIQISESNNASSKAVNDCNQILDSHGVKPFYLKIKKQGNRYLKKINNYLELKKIERIDSGAVVFIPHPIYLNKKYIDVLKKAKQKRKLKLAFIIHDLDSIRKMFPEAAADFEYIDHTMYEIADFVIAHNESMKQYLIHEGVNSEKIFDLQIFDYLTEHDPEDKKVRYSKTLNIAGNLDTNKCKYIKELNNLDKTVNVNLYGLNFNKEILNSESIHYKGAFPADEIPMQLTEGFGLVWDGDSINGCTGNTGDYLRFNNPHKLSLYLVSGLPVIIWSKAAEASFVRKNNVGIVVDSVQDFSNAFDRLSEKQYNDMVENAKKISRGLRKGEYLTSILENMYN